MYFDPNTVMPEPSVSRLNNDTAKTAMWAGIRWIGLTGESLAVVVHAQTILVKPYVAT